MSVLEVLHTDVVRSDEEVCENLAQALAISAQSIGEILQGSWNTLVEAGLVREAAQTARL